MTWDEKDKALLSASRLVGFCQSIRSPAIIDVHGTRSDTVCVTEAWVDGLRRYTSECAEAIDRALNESNGGQS